MSDSNISSAASVGIVRAALPTGQPADPKLWEAAQGFEEVLMKQFVSTMRTTELKGDLIEESAGHETYDPMLSEALGSQLAKRGMLNLAPHIYRQMGGRYTPPETAAAPTKGFPTRAATATPKPLETPDVP